MAQTIQKLLTDSSENLFVDAWQLTSESVADYDGPPWAVTKYVLLGGKQHGVDVVEIDNGEMAVTVIPSRGMNVLEARTSDATLGWDSPVREVIHPAYVQAESRGGMGWLTGFNELMCRCGLESTGVPGPDTIINNQGDEVTVTLPLHGNISNIPASRLWVSVELGETCRLTVGGEVNETMMFGPSLRLSTAVSTVPGSAEFTIHDQVRNMRAVPSEMELLYHCNYGPPILEEGARLVAPVRRVSARGAAEAREIGHWDLYRAPKAGFVEQCYFFTLHGDRTGRTAVALVSPKEDLAASLRFSVRQLPVFTVWKNTAAEADGYVTGLEPATDYPNPRQFERQQGRVIELAPGETREVELTLGLVSGKSAVRALRGEIAALGKGKKCTVCDTVDKKMSPG